MDLTNTELYLIAVIGILIVLYIYTRYKLDKAVFSGRMLTQVIKAVAAGKGELTSTPDGEVTFKQTKE